MPSNIPLFVDVPILVQVCSKRGFFCTRGSPRAVPPLSAQLFRPPPSACISEGIPSMGQLAGGASGDPSGPRRGRCARLSRAAAPWRGRWCVAWQRGQRGRRAGGCWGGGWCGEGRTGACVRRGPIRGASAPYACVRGGVGVHGARACMGAWVHARRRARYAHGVRTRARASLRAYVRAGGVRVVARG